MTSVSRLARKAACAATLLLFACTPARPVPFGEGLPPAGSIPGQPDLEEAMHALVDLERERQGLPPLEWDPALSTLSRMHSHDMIAQDFVDHVSPTTGRPADRLRRAGYLARVSLENIAVHQTLEGAHQNLMNSPGHRANILSDAVRVVGIGVVRDGADLFVTQLFADPADIDDPDALARALVERVNGARVAAGLEPLAHHPELQRVVTEAVATMPAPPTEAALDQLGRAALAVTYEDPVLGGVAVSAQTALGKADLSVPDPAVAPNAVAVASSAHRTERPDGTPTVIVLVVFGLR